MFSLFPTAVCLPASGRPRASLRWPGDRRRASARGALGSPARDAGRSRRLSARRRPSAASAFLIPGRVARPKQPPWTPPQWVTVPEHTAEVALARRAGAGESHGVNDRGFVLAAHARRLAALRSTRPAQAFQFGGTARNVGAGSGRVRLWRPGRMLSGGSTVAAARRPALA